jgi:hypothetical protein
LDAVEPSTKQMSNRAMRVRQGEQTRRCATICAGTRIAHRHASTHIIAYHSDDRSGIAAWQCDLLASSMWDAPDPARLLCGVIHPRLQDLIHPALPGPVRFRGGDRPRRRPVSASNRLGWASFGGPRPREGRITVSPLRSSASSKNVGSNSGTSSGSSEKLSPKSFLAGVGVHLAVIVAACGGA